MNVLQPIKITREGSYAQRFQDRDPRLVKCFEDSELNE
jgi:hypothetical protein